MTRAQTEQAHLRARLRDLHRHAQEAQRAGNVTRLLEVIEKSQRVADGLRRIAS